MNYPRSYYKPPSSLPGAAPWKLDGIPVPHRDSRRIWSGEKY
ncbi:MAG: hypothetical protein QM730_15285 [Anaerolineales bacterium]